MQNSSQKKGKSIQVDKKYFKIYLRKLKMMEVKKLFSPFNVYYFSVVLLAASLPLSVFTTSLAEIILILNWLREGDFKGKWRKLQDRKAFFFIAGVYILHLAGLIYTHASNHSYALHDLRIKLPVLILPLIFASSPSFEVKKLRFILLVFASATIVSSLVSFAVFLGILDFEYYDFRDISIFISHIRLALMVNFSIFILLFYMLRPNKELRIKKSYILYCSMAVVWLIFFLVLLKSLTGLFILSIMSLVLAWIYSSRITDVAPRFIIRSLIIVIPLLMASFLSRSIGRFYYTEEVDFSRLEEFSPSGNIYFHDTTLLARENGHYVWLYLCEKELRNEWNKISELSYDGKDYKGQQLKYTLIRYLSSIGERKDSTGVHALGIDDIHAIENGMANRIFTRKYSLYPRIYEVIWEIDGYLKGGDPSGHSVAQRIEYLTAAKSIIKDNWIIGVGTGDVQDSFNRFYESSGSQMKENYRRRAHNQYVTFLLSFGIIGFIISMAGIFIPVFMEKRWNDFLFLTFFCIAMISLLNEDTLETQTGVSFFMFFYALLLFGREKRKVNG